MLVEFHGYARLETHVLVLSSYRGVTSIFRLDVNFVFVVLVYGRNINQFVGT